MKIKTKLQLSAIFSVCVALGIGFTLFLISQEVHKAIDRDKIADEIAKGVFELNIITYEYLLHHEDRMKEQWQSRHGSLIKHLRRAEFKRTEEQVLWERILQSQESIKALFSQLVTIYERHGNNKRETLSELEERIIGQMLVKSQAMVSSAFQLAESSRAEVEAAQKRGSLLFVSFVIVIATIMGVTSFLISKSVVRPVTKLHQGTEIIGAGNLDYRVGTAAKDEIGQLSRAFDQMAERLKTILVSRDELSKEIIEHKRVKEALQAANKELEAFGYSVSHDLRAPLRSIDGFSQALLEDCLDRLDEQSKNYLNRVRSASQRMGQLIDDLLKLSRVTRTEMRHETVDMSTISGKIREELQKTQPERQAEFVIPKGLVATGDARLLRVVLDNLIGNAWKFTGKQPKARIEFGMVQKDGEKVYFVRDNGAGFDMAYSGKLFAPFQRLHSPTEFPGTGIGLATVQRIIHRHGGRVWAEGEVEKGATFYFTIP